MTFGEMRSHRVSNLSNNHVLICTAPANRNDLDLRRGCSVALGIIHPSWASVGRSLSNRTTALLSRSTLVVKPCGRLGFEHPETRGIRSEQ